MVDVFEQVEEELRADRWKTLVKRFLPFVLLGLVIGLIAAAGVYGWREYQRRGSEAASTAYAEGLDLLVAGNTRAAEPKFQVAAEGRSPVYQSLALMQIGGMRLAAGDTRAAAARFDQAAEAAPAPILEDSARLKAVFARMDGQPYAASIEQLTPLAADGRPYRLLALEGLALTRLAAGQTQAARSDVSALSITPDAPEGVRTRAQALLQLIDSGAAASLGPIARAAAALPTRGATAAQPAAPEANAPQTPAPGAAPNAAASPAGAPQP